MDSVDRKNLNTNLVAYALARALFEELDGPGKRLVALKAISFLPPKPSDEMPVDLEMWLDARAELSRLGGLPE